MGEIRKIPCLVKLFLNETTIFALNLKTSIFLLPKNDSLKINRIETKSNVFRVRVTFLNVLFCFNLNF